MNAIKLCPHAISRAHERRSPVKFARGAVRRQRFELERICPRTGSKALVDYREGRAVVERLRDGSWLIRTILEPWMALDGVPVIYDLPPALRSDSKGESKLRFHGTSLADALPGEQLSRLRGLRMILPGSYA